MKNILIAGASGMIGGLVMEGCLERDDVKKVIAITRRPLGIKHEKLIEVIHEDFLDYSKIEAHFKHCDVSFYCIGVYTGKVSKDVFKKVTVDFTKAFGEAVKQHSPNATFCFMSAQGADLTEKSRILFIKQKGIAENILLKLKFKKIHIFRPAYIYPVTPRREPNFMYKILRLLYKPITAIYPDFSVPSTKLAAKMVEVGLNGAGKTIYENRDLRK